MRRRRKTQEDTELDITSFMNLMIILVPVLLISMVFNQITVLELRQELKAQDLNPDDLSLEVIIRENGFKVNLGPLNIESIDKKEGKFDIKHLSMDEKEVG